MYLGFLSTMWYCPPQRSRYEIFSWCLDDEALSPLVKSVWSFSNEVNTRSSVGVLTTWFPSALFEISIAIPSRSVDHENICFPIKVWVLFPGEAWRRMLYPCICTVLSLWFDYCQIMFFPSEVKSWNRNLSPQMVLIFYVFFILDEI